MLLDTGSTPVGSMRETRSKDSGFFFCRYFIAIRGICGIIKNISETPMERQGARWKNKKSILSAELHSRT